MKRFVRILFLILAIFMVALLFGCPATTTTPTATTAQTTAASPTKPAKVITMTYCEVIGNADRWGKINQWIADNIPIATGGRVKINYYPGSSLYAYEETLNALVSGGTDFASAGATRMLPMVPVLAAVLNPFCFENQAHAQALWASELGAEMQAKIEAVGVHKVATFLEAAYPGGIRSLISTATFTTRPITKLEDLKGLRLRIPTDKPILDAYIALGASAIWLPPAEALPALINGMVDGAVATWTGNVIPWSLNKYAPYCLDEPVGAPSVSDFSCNLKSWNRLPPDLQKIITDVVAIDLNKALDVPKEQGKSFEAAVAAYTGDPKTKINRLSAAEKARWVAVLKPLWKASATADPKSGDLGQRILDKIEELRPQFVGK